jgi:bacteriocin biosynthesis cyclodehydratase domain-containing protein
MIRQPEFRTCFQVEITSDEVLLVGSEETISLRGQRYSMLVAEIDGHKTGPEIARNLRGRMSPIDVYHGMRLLEERGLIREASRLDEHTIRVSDLLATDPLSFERRLERSTVSVQSFGQLSAEDLVSILADAKVRTGDDGDLTIVLVDDYLQTELESFNKSALESGKPWMLLGVVGACAWIGPIFTPGRPVCWACLRQNIRRNRPELSSAKARTETGNPPSTAHHWPSATVSLAFNLAAIQSVRWLTTDRSILEDRIITLNAVSLRLGEHRLVTQPRCLACDPEMKTREVGAGWSEVSLARDSGAPRRPIDLTSPRRLSTGEGGFRIQAPETTLSALRHHLSPITGVVGPLFSICREGNDQILNVYTTRPNLAERGTRFKSPALGKGTTPVQAQVSALCESLERYSSLYHGDEPRKKASYASLGERAIHPNRCMLFSDAQYENREKWNSGQPTDWVPNRMDEDNEIEWSPVWSLTDESWRYLPMSYCFLRYPASPETACCLADSNGVAAGNCVEEAVLQGFFELVERDSVAIWWYNRLRRAEIDLEAFGTPYLTSLQDYYSTLGRRLWVLDLTTDLAIPAFAAVSTKDAAPQEFIFGFGSHFDPQIALVRALTELNQSLALLDRGALADFIQLQGSTSDSEVSWLRPDSSLPAKSRSDFRTNWSVDLSQNIRRCLDIAARNGLEVLVLNLTRPGLGLSVARVVVPGLRPWWPRFGDGRLYEVPVRMSWCDRAGAESQLNSWHICL